VRPLVVARNFSHGQSVRLSIFNIDQRLLNIEYIYGSILPVYIVIYIKLGYIIGRSTDNR